MQIKQISCTYRRKVNLGNFENADFEIQLVADIEPDDDFYESQQSLWITARHLVKEQAQDLLIKARNNGNGTKFCGLDLDWQQESATTGEKANG